VKIMFVRLCRAS